MSSPLEDWIAKKSQIAIRLGRGEAGGAYSEGILVLAAGVNAIAALKWPARGSDKKRFIELWARYAPALPNSRLISVPLLIAHLEKKGACEQAAALAESNTRAFLFGGSTLVVTGDDVDLSEERVVSQCGPLDCAEVRRYSYANVFYSEVRSSFVHEYQVSEHAATVPMARTSSGVSYVNCVAAPHRRIHFGLDWLAEVASGIASAVGPDPAGVPPPATWWADGA